METYLNENIKLSRREHQILEKILQGNTNKQIARQLILSEYTVRAHRRNILEKTSSRNFVELFNICYKPDQTILGQIL